MSGKEGYSVLEITGRQRKHLKVTFMILKKKKKEEGMGHLLSQFCTAAAKVESLRKV